MRNCIRAVFLGAFFSLWFSGNSNAFEVETGLGPVWWQYEELSQARAGFASTPLHSSSRGYGLEGELAVNGTVGEQWLANIALVGMLPLNRADERWDLANGTQSNRLDITELEISSDLLYRFAAFDLGVWTAYQWHEQKRRSFVINGVAAAVSGEPVRETIQSAWAGVTMQASSHENGLTTKIEAAVPVWVKTTNSSLPGVAFTKKKGFRLGAQVAWEFPWGVDGMDWTAKIKYRYRELGDDLQAAALWPKNRWQTVSAGLEIHW